MKNHWFHFAQIYIIFIQESDFDAAIRLVCELLFYVIRAWTYYNRGNKE